jgi:O-antigen ligase/polysaccharide polymerase Wzy-like membrane protein
VNSTDIVSGRDEMQTLANRVLALCAPLTPLSASISYFPVFRWIGWLATTVAVIAAAASWLWDENRSAVYPTLLGAIVACLVFMGIGFHGLPAQSAYIEIVQLFVLWVILSQYRTVIGSPRFNLAALLTVGLMVLVNFSAESTFELFQNNRSWTSPIFSNPNLFGMVFVVLAIFAFMLTRTVWAPSLKLPAYALCIVVLLFIAASGSRSSMLAVGVFFTAYVIGKNFSRNRTLLWGGAILTLVMVPVATFTYLAAVGAHINLLPEPQLPTTTQHSPSTCIPTPYAVCPRTEPMPDVDNRGGGPLAVNKSLRTGREIIWPKVIELSGDAPMCGHGLGSSPAGLLPHPFIGMHAHSGFLQVYYQFGIVGLALYFLLWGVLFSRAIKVRDPLSRTISFAVLCAACVLDTLGLVFIQHNTGIGVALGILATTEFLPTQRVGQVDPPGVREQTAATSISKLPEGMRISIRSATR